LEGEIYTEQKLQDMIDQYDTDGDGNTNFSEYLTIMAGMLTSSKNDHRKHMAKSLGSHDFTDDQIASFK